LSGGKKRPVCVKKSEGSSTVAFAISKPQQKAFVQEFIEQVLTVALDLVGRGSDKGSPGATFHAVGHAVIREIYGMDGRSATPPENLDA
jgi:hypothetical protein